MLPLFHGFKNLVDMNRLSQPALCFFFGDQIKEKMRAFAETVPYPEGVEGLSVADREKELARLDKEIADIEAKLSEIRQQATEAGISLGNRDLQDETRLFAGGVPTDPEARRKAQLHGSVLRDTLED